jgi:hypothetical protein
MAAISTTKWFTHTKTLKYDETLRRCNWLSVRRLNN